ncbi:MAG: LysR family transcriptional regulator [Solobacterium sp.]|nr:LysR family transcriptional regulator [Solobacterium sp.]
MTKRRIITDIDRILAIAEYQSISKAARMLDISQSSLSRAVREIENNLNVTLFVRTNEGTTLTDEGRICVDYLWQMKEAEEDLRKSLDFLKSSLFRLNIALPFNINPSAIEIIEKQIYQKYPDAEIHFYNVFANKVPQGLLSKQYDLAICWDETDNDPRFRFETFYDDHLLLLVPADYPPVNSHTEIIHGIEAEVVDVKDINGLDFVLQNSGTSIHQTIDLLLTKHHLSIKTRLLVSNSMMAIRCVEEGIGCALVMESYSLVVFHSDKIKKYVINDNVGERIGLLTLAEKELSPLEHYASDVIRDYLYKRNQKYSIRNGSGDTYEKP